MRDLRPSYRELATCLSIEVVFLIQHNRKYRTDECLTSSRIPYIYLPLPARVWRASERVCSRFLSLHFFRGGLGGGGGGMERVMEWEASKIFAPIIVGYTASGRTRAVSKAVGV